MGALACVRRLRRLARGCTGWSAALLVAFVPVLMFLACVGKFLDWGSYEQAVATFSLVPPLLQAAGAIAIPALEAAAFFFLIASRTEIANWVSSSLLVCFILLIGYQWAMNVLPSCACLGLWSAYFRVKQTAQDLIVRDVVLLVIALAGAVTARAMRSSAVTGVEAASDSRSLS